MKIVNGFDLISYARKHGFLLPAFNTTNMEMTYGIINGLQESGFPGFIQISSSNLALSDPCVIAHIVKAVLKECDIPVSLHLDHGKSFEDVKRCVDAGFTSIMIDASHLPFEENIQEVKRTVDYCHFYGIPVEAELGAIKGKEDEISSESDARTDPDMVKEFVESTDCDMLAVSVGNVHGLEIEPNIDLALLARIHSLSPCPLVMHGGSGIPFGILREARKQGLIKVNFGADLRKAFIKTFGEVYEKDRNAHNVYSVSVKAVENVKLKAKELVTEINL